MMDRDLAVLYGVETKVLNQAVKRNIERFPERYMFQLTENEEDFLRSQIVTLKIENNLKSQFVTSSWGGSRKPPSVFTEFGIVMLSSALRSSRAISISIQITDAFIEMRKFLRDNADVLARLDNVERKHALLQC